uniref:Uncharacterized protein n=1 Tax=Oryza punctata TaxID=4537 RepID=A0A0E0M0M2_ORYPU
MAATAICRRKTAWCPCDGAGTGMAVQDLAMGSRMVPLLSSLQCRLHESGRFGGQCELAID